MCIVSLSSARQFFQICFHLLFPGCTHTSEVAALERVQVAVASSQLSKHQTALCSTSFIADSCSFIASFLLCNKIIFEIWLLLLYSATFKSVSQFQLWPYVALCVCAQSLSCVWLFETPWTTASEAPLSMEFSRQEYWNGVSFPTPGSCLTICDMDCSPRNSPGQNTGVGSLSHIRGIFPTQGSNSGLPHCSGFFTSWAIREALSSGGRDQICISCVSCIGRQILYHWATWEAQLGSVPCFFHPESPQSALLGVAVVVADIMDLISFVYWNVRWHFLPKLKLGEEKYFVDSRKLHKSR